MKTAQKILTKDYDKFRRIDFYETNTKILNFGQDLGSKYQLFKLY